MTKISSNHSDQTMLVEDTLIERWLQSKAPNTRRIYKHAIDHLRTSSSKLLAETNSQDISAWKATLADTGASAGRIAQMLSAISSAYEFLMQATANAASEPIYRDNPVALVPRPTVEQKARPRHLTLPQVRALLNAIPVDTVRGLQHYALLVTALLTGMPSSALCELRYDDKGQESA